ncbi:RNA polymerase sigma factor [Sorangium sp. So ce362]|uniref:RNA polymerase sigma factor n=1 Tax=Sorangium sp. So ce362 TaxID=3133303 RepID=UPI003F60CEA8
MLVHAAHVPARSPNPAPLSPGVTRAAGRGPSLGAARTAPGEGSRAAVDELLRGLVEMTPELFGRALRLSRSPATAEDLVQDTVERAIRFAESYERGTNLRAWVHQILFSVFITRCRRSRRERNALDVLATDPCAWTAPERRAEVHFLSPGVRRALATLPPTFRDTVVLVDLEEMSYKDAATRLGVPVGTVMSRLHRGRKLLAEALRGESGGPRIDVNDANDANDAKIDAQTDADRARLPH